MSNQELQNAIDDLETISNYLSQHPNRKHEAEALDYCIVRIINSTNIDDD